MPVEATYLETYILPIMLGITTTLVIYLGNSLFQDVFLPWYVEKRSQGLSLSGPWESSFDFPDHDLRAQESIRVSQQVTSVTGTIQYTEIQISTNTVKCQKEFQIEGTFENMILCATYATRHRNDIGRGAICLRVKDSNILIGQTAVLDPESKEIVPRSYTWTRP